MKRLPTGLIVFDTIDIVCISFSAGSTLAFLIKKYQHRRQRQTRGVDPIVNELREKSPIRPVSVDGKPLRLPVVRGGAKRKLRTFSLMLKSKKLARLIQAIVDAKTKQKQLKLLSMFFAILNAVLTHSTGFRFGVGGSMGYIQIILIAFPSTLGGFLATQVVANPLVCVFVPLAILFGRGIEDIPDSSEKCRVICKVAEEFHNKQLALEMEEFNSLLKETSDALKLPLDKVPLLCEEEKLSLMQRYKLRSLIDSQKTRKRVQHFKEFIEEKFPECAAKPEAVYEELVGESVGKIAESCVSCRS